MPYVEWEGEAYRDDRLFVLHVARCSKQEVEAGLLQTTIFHEEIPEGAGWCLATYRNTARWPLARVDHFATRDAAENYAREVEPTVPLISRGGRPMSPPLQYDEWARLKERSGWAEYDYTQMYSPGGESAREIAVTPTR